MQYSSARVLFPRHPCNAQPLNTQQAHFSLYWTDEAVVAMQIETRSVSTCISACTEVRHPAGPTNTSQRSTSTLPKLGLCALHDLSSLIMRNEDGFQQQADSPFNNDVRVIGANVDQGNGEPHRLVLEGCTPCACVGHFIDLYRHHCCITSQSQHSLWPQVSLCSIRLP